jgi:hypothetical protein
MQLNVNAFAVPLKLAVQLPFPLSTKQLAHAFAVKNKPIVHLLLFQLSTQQFADAFAIRNKLIVHLINQILTYQLAPAFAVKI